MRAYTVSMQNQTVIANVRLVGIHTQPADYPTRLQITDAWCSQIETETSQQLGVMVASVNFGGGPYTSFTAATPRPLVIGGAASGIVGGTGGLVVGTSGVNSDFIGNEVLTPLVCDGFNNLLGWWWRPDYEIVIPADAGVFLALIGTPAVLSGWNAGINFREIS